MSKKQCQNFGHVTDVFHYKKNMRQAVSYVSLQANDIEV